MKLAEINLRPHALDIQRYVIEHFAVEETASSGRPLVEAELSVVDSHVGVIMSVDLPYFKDQVFIFPMLSEGAVRYFASEVTGIANIIGDVKSSVSEVVDLAVKSMSNEKTLDGKVFIYQFCQAYRIPKHAFSLADSEKLFMGILEGRKLKVSNQPVPVGSNLIASVLDKRNVPTWVSFES